MNFQNSVIPIGVLTYDDNISIISKNVYLIISQLWLSDPACAENRISEGLPPRWILITNTLEKRMYHGLLSIKKRT